MLTNYYFLPTMVGSLPHKDVKKAFKVVKDTLKEAPAFPQLPNRDPKEGMILQTAIGLPGLKVQDGKCILDIESADMNELQDFITRIKNDDPSKSAIPEDAAAGLYEMIRNGTDNPLFIKGQLCGPITLAANIYDPEGNNLLGDPEILTLITKHVRLKAMWMDQLLRNYGQQTLICFDEPSFTEIEKVEYGLSYDHVISILRDVFSAVSGNSAFHCCADINWPVVMEAAPNIISFDAVKYGQRMFLTPLAVSTYLELGGSIAWGIVPTGESQLNSLTVPQLAFQYNALMLEMINHGIDSKELYSNSLITPECGLACLDEATAEKALQITVELSNTLRSLLEE